MRGSPRPWLQWGWLLLAANFLIPLGIYIAAPELAIAGFEDLTRFVGGPAFAETDRVFWYVLALGNVATLGFCCLLLLYDFARYEPIIVPLVFLKGCSMVGFGAAFSLTAFRPFLLASLFDGLTCLAFVFLARSARRGLPPIA